jgi:membrane-bound lytic murein transglycosylase D
MLLAVGRSPALVCAQEGPFPVPVGLRDAVDFWKQVFTRHGFGEVILFDPLDAGMVYSVLRVPESEQGRVQVAKERARIAAAYDLADDETRIRSQRGAKEHFSEGLRVSGRYIAQMQKIFRDEGLPGELAYLPLVESSFNVRARSGAGAVGMWQFIPETGKKFMRIDGNVDERRDPMASTRAAARLLKENYRILGSWPLAITAYNHGTEGIFRAIDSVGSRDLVELIRRYQSPTFGFASKNFYAEFLAVVEIAAEPESHFPFLRLHQPISLHSVEVKKATPVDAVLKPAAISPGDFYQWNPALEAGAKVIPAGYRVNLPAEKIQPFLLAQTRVQATPIKSRAGIASKPRAKSGVGQRTPSSKSPAKNGSVKDARAAVSAAVKDRT